VEEMTKRAFGVLSKLIKPDDNHKKILTKLYPSSGSSKRFNPINKTSAEMNRDK
uniref:Uncharacterized protein n=1 Tax=Amphimedon queenslandica TaxID=400682 RepID=A0A1X7U1R9_AMPQE